MAVNGNRKGKVGEREFAAFLREHGFEARRGQQFAGGGDSPDVVTSVAGFHFEVKRVEALQLYPSLDQAEADRRDDETPVVVHRRNGKVWVAIMFAEDLMKLLKERQNDQEEGA